MVGQSSLLESSVVGGTGVVTSMEVAEAVAVAVTGGTEVIAVTGGGVLVVTVGCSVLVTGGKGVVGGG